MNYSDNNVGHQLVRQISTEVSAGHILETFSQQLTMPYCFAEMVLTHIHLYILYGMKKSSPSLELHFNSMSM